jgi:hypothetical protein
MEQIKQYLEPVIDWLPPGAQDYWWLFFGAACLIVLLLVLTLWRTMLRALFGRRVVPVLKDFGPREKLDDYPLPAEPWGPRRLTVEGVPVRLRLVVVAPVGKKASVNENTIADTLDQVLWGLGAIAQRDQPRVRIWPPQLSQHGFTAAFYRSVQRPEPEGQPSRWVLVAGVTPPRPQALLVGMALWADNPTLIGRRNLEPRQWADLLRIQSFE